MRNIFRSYYLFVLFLFVYFFTKVYLYYSTYYYYLFVENYPSCKKQGNFFKFFNEIGQRIQLTEQPICFPYLAINLQTYVNHIYIYKLSLLHPKFKPSTGIK